MNCLVNYSELSWHLDIKQRFSILWSFSTNPTNCLFLGIEVDRNGVSLFHLIIKNDSVLTSWNFAHVVSENLESK